MTQFSVKKNNIDSVINAENKLVSELSSLESEIRSVSNSLGFQIAAKANIRNRLNNTVISVSAHRTAMNGMRSALQDTINVYNRTENTILGNLNVGNAKAQNASGICYLGSGHEEDDGWEKKALDWLWKGVGVFGPTGKITSGIGKFVTGDKATTTTWAKAVKDVGKGVLGLVKATKEADTKADWFKQIFGLNEKSLETGIKIKGSDVAFSAIVNAAGNYEEYKTGAITANRAIAEWVTETALDVGKDALIATGVTAAFTLVGFAPPVFVFGAVTVVASTVADWVFEKVTGQKMTEAVEAVSDLVLDTVESGLNLVKTGAKKVSEGTAALWSNVKKGWSNLTSGGWSFKFA